MFAVQLDGHKVTTIEGLGSVQALSKLQQAFHEEHGLQCGFCTPGILMTLVELLKENPFPTESEVRDRLSGNICRCTGYESIVDAALLAAKRIAEGDSK
jgi:carbon-monoxide dehydrogenase small subunit